jgi:hypothetical protein
MPKLLLTIEIHKEPERKGSSSWRKNSLVIPILVFESRKNIARRLEALGSKYKMARFADVSADSRAIMKGAIHEETFSANFSCGNTGDRGHVRSCRCDQTKGQRGVRIHLYRSQAQLSRRLFL